MVIPTILNLAGAIFSLSRASILLCGVSIVVYGIYMLAGFWRKSSSSRRLITLAVAATVLLTGVLGSTIMAPKAYKDEISTITFESVLERVSGHRYHNRVAMNIFSDYPFFGSGAWGYPHYQKIYMDEKEIKSMQIIGGANVHNDYCQFLAEFGAVGFGIILATVMRFVAVAVVKLLKYSRAVSTKNINLSPNWLYRLPPEAVGVFLATACILIHALGDIPLRTPAVLIMWICVWVCIDGFIPAINRK
jgi:O-antigen ligase